MVFSEQNSFRRIPGKKAYRLETIRLFKRLVPGHVLVSCLNPCRMEVFPNDLEEFSRSARRLSSSFYIFFTFAALDLPTLIRIGADRNGPGFG